MVIAGCACQDFKAFFMCILMYDNENYIVMDNCCKEMHVLYTPKHIVY